MPKVKKKVFRTHVETGLDFVKIEQCNKGVSKYR